MFCTRTHAWQLRITDVTKIKLMHSEEDDVANDDEEERFETGVRRSALDFVQHDKNADN